MTEPGGSENRGAQRRLGRAQARRKPRFTAVGRFPAAALVLAALGLWLASASWAQTAEVYPAVLRQVPVQSPGASSYWQQLRLTLEQADAASDAAIAIDLPPGVTIDDRDGDGAAYDEIRVVYQPRAAESPDFSASTATTTARIVLKSQAPAAAGGRVYVQFPIAIGISHSFTSTQYGAVRFDDSREQDLLSADQLPELTLVDVGEFALFGSLDLLVLDPVVAPGPDTTTSAVGTAFPGEPQVLVLSLPDLVFDGGPGRPNRQVGWGDGDDSNDTVYRFYFSTNPSLVRIDSTAVQARRLDGSLYVEREGAGESVQLLTSGLPEGTHYLYAASAVTGDLALARGAFRQEDVCEVDACDQ